MSQITSLPYWILFIIVTSIGMLTAEAGSWLHSVRQKKGIVDKDGSSGSLIGAMLGLLAFILGFTFSITASRYSDRKNIVVEQARTISNCYFRTSLIPD